MGLESSLIPFFFPNTSLFICVNDLLLPICLPDSAEYILMNLKV